MKLDYIFKFCRKNKYISLEQYGDMKYLSDGVVTVLVQGFIQSRLTCGII